jgi:hypothetical protein
MPIVGSSPRKVKPNSEDAPLFGGLKHSKTNIVTLGNIGFTALASKVFSRNK